MKPLHLLVIGNRVESLDVLTPLRDAGHRVVVAPDGASAAEALGAPGFDGLLLDLSHPLLDPVALRRALAPGDATPPASLEDAERRHIALMLHHTAGNKRRAAGLLGISRSTLLHKVRKYGLDGVR